MIAIREAWQQAMVVNIFSFFVYWNLIEGFTWASRDNENWTMRMPDNVFGGATNQHMFETGGSVRGRHKSNPCRYLPPARKRTLLTGVTDLQRLGFNLELHSNRSSARARASDREPPFRR